MYDFISKENPLILASASQRRKQLLEQVGLPIVCLPSKVEENVMNKDPYIQAKLLAEKKGRAVTFKTEGKWILGADTIVFFKDIVLGKPSNVQEARSMLSILSGNEHKVITGFCIFDPNKRQAKTGHSVSSVRFKKLTPEEIDAYISTGEPFGKAGSYAIQGIGAFIVESIHGSYTNIVGLPVCALIKTLIEIKALENFPLL